MSVILGRPHAETDRKTLRLLTELLPGLAALVVFLWWTYKSGGYFPSAWYPGAIFFIAVLLVVLVAWPALLRGLDSPTQIALVALAGFTIWSFASIGWAGVKGDAWDGANRTALYLIVFTLFALWPWTVLSAIALLGSYGVGVCLIGFFTLVAAGRSDDVEAYYNDGRFSDPVGYVNGNAALFVLCFWPALFLASRRELPTLLRPLFLAVAGVTLQLAVLPQSRGAAIAFPLVLTVYFAVVPGRMRSLVFLVPVALALAVTLPELLESGAETDPTLLAAGARSAAVTIAIAAAALFGAGILMAVADRRLDLSERVRRLTATAVAAVVLLAAIGATVLVATTSDPAARVRVAWEEFATDVRPGSGSSYLLSGFQTNRPDLWRVALNEFREHPVRGIGVENFTVAYVHDRRSNEETLYPHSFPLQVLSQTGLVGAALFLVFLSAALFAAFAARARQPRLSGGLSAVGIVLFVSWLAHGSIDWFWELPALAAPALAFLALAGSLGRPLPDAFRSVPRALPVLLMAALVLTSGSFALPWLSDRQSSVAASVWRTDHAAAIAAVERARRLNPLTERADLVAGSIAWRRQDWGAMVRAYERALERNPHSWYANLQLALALAKENRLVAARRQLVVARRLNPTDPVIDTVGRWLERGEEVDVAAVARIFRLRHRQVVR